MQNTYKAILVVILITHHVRTFHSAGTGRVVMLTQPGPVNAGVHSLLQLVSLHQFSICFSTVGQ